jgi:NAD(P)-dependent dehydrogenase (short-subunit alcohol dehydrogenase family)
VLAALTKDGLAAATRSLAVEYASRGIRVTVSPSVIQIDRPGGSHHRPTLPTVPGDQAGGDALGAAGDDGYLSVFPVMG